MRIFKVACSLEFLLFVLACSLKTASPSQTVDFGDIFLVSICTDVSKNLGVKIWGKIWARDSTPLALPRPIYVRAGRGPCTVLGLLEIQYFGNEDGVMNKNGKTGRRYSAEKKAADIS